MLAPDASAVVVEFQRRRRLWLSIAVPCMLVFFATVFESFTMQALPSWVTYSLAFSGLAGWLISERIIYRCPSCNAVPKSGDGTPFSPKQCHNCGVPLKRANAPT
jgi:hypothetical protein